MNRSLCVQAPCLAHAFALFGLIYGDVSILCCHHSNAPTCFRRQIIWIALDMEDGLCMVRAHQSRLKLEIGQDAIGTHFHELLEERFQKCHYSCLLRKDN